jgi:hypothetical protein
MPETPLKVLDCAKNAIFYTLAGGEVKSYVKKFIKINKLI